MFKAFSVTRKHWPIVALLAIATLPIGDSIAHAGNANRNLTISQIPCSGLNLKLPEITYNPSMLVDPYGASGLQVLSVLSRDGKLGVVVKLRSESPKAKAPLMQVMFPGDSLKDGQIVLKRIEKRNTAMVAVLEENEVEVERYVGDL
jgi:hypothetical protein